MFDKKELTSLLLLVEQYDILICNAHDIRLKSKLTGHEWTIISPYDNSSCEILHRHSARYPFHHQRGRYESLASAIGYINSHDEWHYEKAKRHNERQISIRMRDSLDVGEIITK